MPVNPSWHKTTLEDYSWLMRIRPMSLRQLMLRLFGPDERRRIYTTGFGLLLYLDPFSHLGSRFVLQGDYEPDVRQIFRDVLRIGDTVVDIGANEGIFTAYAGTLVGDRGNVIAIEPQSRLTDLISINCMLNGVRAHHVYQAAVGGPTGTVAHINLWPSMNSGASNITSSYRFWKASETTSYISLGTTLKELEIEIVHLVKIDVEGFEQEVVQHLIPLAEEGRIKRILLDYHDKVLAKRQIDPSSIDAMLRESGMTRNPVESADQLSGYVLYTHVG